MLEKINNDATLLKYLEDIQSGERIKFYPQENLRQSTLELIGILKADSSGYCMIRNKICEQALRTNTTLAINSSPAAGIIGQKAVEELTAKREKAIAPVLSEVGEDFTTDMPVPDTPQVAGQLSVNTPSWPRKHPFSPGILIMKGGGVKGIAYVGALKVLEEYDFSFEHFVGTSAGAISAALLAVGYNAKELGEILAETNFKNFKDGWLPLSLLLLPFRKGLYEGEEFRRWMEELLRKKFPQFAGSVDIRFPHLNLEGRPPRRLTIFASTKGRRAHAFDSDGPAKCKDKISFACRCSMAIPYFFRPEKIEGERVIDGGVQNNYPVFALLDTDPSLKDSNNFVGLYLGHKTVKKTRKLLLLDLFSIWSEAGDEEAKVRFIDRTIVIDPRPVKTTDFALSSTEIKFLLAEGKASALRWLHHWGNEKRPNLETVAQAEKESAELRANAIAERWKRFWPKLALSILILFVLVIAIPKLVAATYRYVFSPRCGPEQMADMNLRSYWSNRNDLSSLDRAIDGYFKAYGENPCDIISLLSNRGTALEERYDAKHNLQDLEQAIRDYSEAIQRIDDGAKVIDDQSSKITLLKDRGYAWEKYNQPSKARKDFLEVCRLNRSSTQCSEVDDELRKLPPE